MAAPLFDNRMRAVNPDLTWSFDSLQKLQSLVQLSGGDTGEISASRITVSPTGSLSSTDAQSAFAELDAEKEATGTAAAAIAAHVALADPHTQYTTAAELATGLATKQDADADLTVWAGKTAPAGVVVGTTDAQTLENKTLTSGAVALASGSIGYATGNGGTVVQAANKSTGVTLNEPSGEITLNAAALAAATPVSFTFSNSTIAATDVLILNHASAGTAGAYTLNAQCAAGSALITVRNVTAGSLSEAIVIRFAVLKGATS